MVDYKSFEVAIHAQHAFDKCRNEVMEYENCRDTGSISLKDPVLCREQAVNLHSCYKKSEKIIPLCLNAFNTARECLFKSDGNLYNCKNYVNYYLDCQSDPKEYIEFLKASTEKQKMAYHFDFSENVGHYDVNN